MIVFDTETTGLITNEALPLKDQPHIIEIGALKIDANGVEIDSFSSLVRPSNFDGTLPAVITKITSIEAAQLAEAPLFIELFGALAAFFLGEREMLAHNAGFDLMMLVFELRRCGKKHHFPYCSVVTDTRAVWPHKLVEWGKRVKGADFVQSHRALEDCRLLRDCYFSGVVDG